MALHIHAHGVTPVDGGLIVDDLEQGPSIRGAELADGDGHRFEHDAGLDLAVDQVGARPIRQVDVDDELLVAVGVDGHPPGHHQRPPEQVLG
jgi:hypothetical protein